MTLENSFGMASNETISLDKLEKYPFTTVSINQWIEWRSHGLIAEGGDIFKCYDIEGRHYIVFERLMPWLIAPTRTLCRVYAEEFTVQVDTD